MAKKKERTFEDSLKRLQEISELLESEDIDLEKSIKLYEEGIVLSKQCFEWLKKAELKVTELKNQLNSTFKSMEESE
ncbi:MAG: exodeoxyribonuclease VII small subunit [Ignavibacteria bacterium RBG_13_36_8]|nr:MAG: exodeoxyribonuclease VII small subunit [Ignavibacteria bacterium RBG_13_36_8]